MRGGILAAGIILLIFGIFLYFTGNNMIREVEAYDVEGIPISEILKLVSPDVREHYETGQSLVMFGSIFGIVGFILCIAGIAAPSKKPQVIVQQSSCPSPVVINHPSKVDRRCPSCGRVIPDDAKMCPYCGKKFKTHFKEEYEEEPKIEKEEKTKKESKEENKIPKFCPECGAKLDEGLDFCTNCGIKLK